MAMNQRYPTGPIGHFFEQLSDLQQFSEHKQNRFKELTDREMEVLGLVAEGMKNSAISEKLEISRATVQNHRASVRDKLNLSHQTDYIKYALAFDLIAF